MPACVGIGCRRFVPARCRLRRVPTTPAGSLAGCLAKCLTPTGEDRQDTENQADIKRRSMRAVHAMPPPCPTWVSKSS